jgi:outer membrane protein TolC
MHPTRFLVPMSLALALLAALPAAGGEALSLRDVLDRVDAQSPRPQAAEAARDAAAAEVKNATAAMLPTFTVS